jgi:hypothetical protein
VHEAAAGHDTLVCLAAAVIVGAVILLPALVLLFRPTLVGRFRAAELVVPSDTRKGAEARTPECSPDLRWLA